MREGKTWILRGRRLWERLRNMRDMHGPQAEISGARALPETGAGEARIDLSLRMEF